MANREKLRIKSAQKRSRQNTKRNALKGSQRALTRTAIKAVNVAGKAMALTAHKLLTDQNLYKKVKNEHQELT